MINVNIFLVNFIIFRKDLVNFTIAKCSCQAFVGPVKTDEKRQIAYSVFSNLKLNSVSLCAEHRLPFRSALFNTGRMCVKYSGNNWYIKQGQATVLAYLLTKFRFFDHRDYVLHIRIGLDVV